MIISTFFQMRVLRCILHIGFFAFLLADPSLGQQLSPTSKADSILEKKAYNYLNRQSAAFLKDVDAIIKKYPPQLPLHPERRLGFELIDAVMHDKQAAFRKPVQDFFHQRIENVLNEIETTKVRDGAMIWKLYNMGFIVRTQSVTVAFDLVSGKNSGSDSFALSGNVMNRLIKQCDALFISHYHKDHAEEATAQGFIDAGKPVVAPPQIWEGKPIHSLITHLKREANTIQSLKLAGNRTLRVVVFPGHQMQKTENNVPLIYTPEGLTFSHMGDQINEGNFMIDYDWIDHVSAKHHVDVLMPPCWTNEIFRIVKGFNPALVIPGHENELGHTLDDRVPFWGDSEFLELTYPELKQSAYKTLIMTWGESFHYHRR
jgi:L-ascorbate metabolism protein UlaG (beta-lactamase superfamily)